MNLPSIDSLICFEAAARLSSFREAAKIVCLTPAAVGQRIHQLEEQLGVELFHRTARSVRVTEAALQLLPIVRSAISAAKGVVEAAQRAEGPPPQEITIGTSYEIGLSWLSPALLALGDELPQLTTHLYFGPAPDFLARLKAMEIDAAVTSFRVLDPVFTWLPLKEEKYVLVASASLLDEIPFDRAEDAAQHTILDIRPALPMLQHLLDAPGCPPLAFQKARSLGSTAPVRRFVLEGEGVAVLPTYLVESDLEEKRLVRVLPEIEPLTNMFRLVFLKEDTRHSAYQAIARVLVERPIA
jgi:LysR family transcriptional regulator, glycine cleavage system transcriptional activator